MTIEIIGSASTSEKAEVSSSIIGRSMTFTGGWSRVRCAIGGESCSLIRPYLEVVGFKYKRAKTPGFSMFCYRLMADFRGSAIVSKGSRAPSLGTIHLDSLVI